MKPLRSNGAFPGLSILSGLCSFLTNSTFLIPILLDFDLLYASRLIDLETVLFSNYPISSRIARL